MVMRNRTWRTLNVVGFLAIREAELRRGEFTSRSWGTRFLGGFLIRLWLALVLGWGTNPPIVAGDSVQVPVGQRQLFLDDHLVAQMQNVQRTLHQPMKRGAVIRDPKATQAIQIRTSPAWDPVAKTYKIWLLSTDRPLWTSEDGLHWVPGPVPDLRTDHVVYDPHDPDPNRRYKGVQTNEYFAVSADGVHWTKLPVEKVPSSDESNFSYDPAEKLFIHTVKRNVKFGRSVAVAVSRDFQKWDDLGLVFNADEIDQQRGADIIQARIADKTFMPPFYVDEKVFRVDVYNMGVFYYEGQYIGMPAMYHATGPVPNYPNTEGFHVIQLAVSRDLKAWHRVADRATFIGPSRLNSGAYDLTQLLPPSAPVVHGDELWFYYTGLKYRSTFHYKGTYPNGTAEPKSGLEPDHGAVCLAVLRRDGFVSLDAGDEDGFVLTKPFQLTGKNLSLNLKSGDAGSVAVELINAEGQMIATSEPVSGDSIRQPVRWNSAENMQTLIGKPVQLKIRIRNASLFAFEVGT